ncbi:uncharacterized protein LOC143850748 [Tasmannia lanceolata]|uniref:uncharacterized protein LOC143850748 n=1 Tax=Tasmannia lanceolata TaxID=3420 RepID=UPI004064BA28
MQDLRSMASGNGRIFSGDRRMRPHANQALKCPRCDSLNTKFCYYNNYNLSQPRYFCKSCRRYWTKGGVLRNVPVGGGCRKNKRSKAKSSSDLQKDRKSSSHSSSESSSLTAATTTEASASSSSALFNFPSSSLLPSENPSNNPENLAEASDSGIFPASFTSLMNVSNPSILGLNFSDLSPFRLQQENQHNMTSMVEELKIQEQTAGFIDQSITAEFPPVQNRMINGGLTPLEWQTNGDQGLFNLPGSIDQVYYWGQNHWIENDTSLYLP